MPGTYINSYGSRMSDCPTYGEPFRRSTTNHTAGTTVDNVVSSGPMRRITDYDFTTLAARLRQNPQDVCAARAAYQAITGANSHLRRLVDDHDRDLRSFRTFAEAFANGSGSVGTVLGTTGRAVVDARAALADALQRVRAQASGILECIRALEQNGPTPCMSTLLEAERVVAARDGRLFIEDYTSATRHSGLVSSLRRCEARDLAWIHGFVKPATLSEAGV